MEQLPQCGHSPYAWEEDSILPLPSAYRRRGTNAISESIVIDALSGSMFRRLHHVDQILEAAVAGQTVRQIFPGDLSNGRDFYMALIETILPTDFYVWRFPDAHTAGNFATLYAGAEFFREKHSSGVWLWCGYPAIDC